MKTTIIIGASSGVGKALANKLISKGENVIAISRSQPDSNFTSFIAFDILSDNELPKIDGAIDGLVYCPGSINLKPFRSLKKQDFLNELEINVFGAIKSIQAYLPNLQLSAQASIVLYSTVAVQMGMPFHTSISVAKGAVEGLTKSLAAELAPKVRVNCIAPSLTQTAMAEKLLNTPDKIEASNSRHPLKRVGTVDDIANATEFLLSANASWMSGQVIHVDGGMSSLKV